MRDLSNLRLPLLKGIAGLVVAFLMFGFVLPLLVSANNDEGPIVGMVLIVLGSVLAVWGLTKKSKSVPRPGRRSK